MNQFTPSLTAVANSASYPLGKANEQHRTSGSAVLTVDERQNIAADENLAGPAGLVRFKPIDDLIRESD